MSITVEKFEQWCVVEIMGHKKFAGYVTEQSLGGSSFVRIDVPQITLKDGTQLPPFSKLFGSGSIYCLSPCTEETARAFAAQIRSEAFSLYEAPRLENTRIAAEELRWQRVLDEDDEDDELEMDEEQDF
jgi:hypothetical protein